MEVVEAVDETVPWRVDEVQQEEGEEGSDDDDDNEPIALLETFAEPPALAPHPLLVAEWEEAGGMINEEEEDRVYPEGEEGTEEAMQRGEEEAAMAREEEAQYDAACLQFAGAGTARYAARSSGRSRRIRTTGLSSSLSSRRSRSRRSRSLRSDTSRTDAAGPPPA